MTKLASLAFCAATIIQAHAIFFTTHLDGPSEAPPNASPGTGFATLLWDSVAHTMTLKVQFQGLVAPTTAAHIHGPTAQPFEGMAGVRTQLPSFVGFPLGVTSGTYEHTFDLTDNGTYNPGFVASAGGVAQAEAALLSYLLEGRAYLNIHSSTFPGGEIRGFFAVPDISATAPLLLGACLFLFALRGWRKPATSRPN